jgi:hypothetical protein
VISDARGEYRKRSGFADQNAVSDSSWARENGSNRCGICAIDDARLRRELVPRDDVRGPDCRSFS